MKDLEGREKDDASKASAMDGNYGGVGSGLESKFRESANDSMILPQVEKRSGTV